MPNIYQPHTNLSTWLNLSSRESRKPDPARIGNHSKSHRNVSRLEAGPAGGIWTCFQRVLYLKSLQRTLFQEASHNDGGIFPFVVQVLEISPFHTSWGQKLRIDHESTMGYREKLRTSQHPSPAPHSPLQCQGRAQASWPRNAHSFETPDHKIKKETAKPPS